MIIRCSGAPSFGLEPRQCVVFEDSLNGLLAAKASGAYVVGLTTGLPEETVRPYCQHVMPDFQNFTVAQMLAIQKQE